MSTNGDDVNVMDMDIEEYRQYLGTIGREPAPAPQQPVTPVVKRTASQKPQQPQTAPEPRKRAPWEIGGAEKDPDVLSALDAVMDYDLAGEWQRADNEKARRFQQELDDQEAAEQKAKEQPERIKGWTY
jgi:hypothetical protein